MSAEMLTGNRHTVWQTRTDHVTAAPPVVAADLVITCGVDQSSREALGFVDAWDRRTGEHRWTYAGDDGNGVSCGISGAPAVADDRLCFADGRGVSRCLAIDSGEEIWRYASDKPVYAGLTIADGRVLLGGDDGRLASLDLSTGTPQWTFEVGDVIRSTPTIVHNHAVVASWNGLLHAVTLDGRRAGTVDLWPCRTTRMVARDDRLVLFDTDNGDVRMISLTQAIATMRLRESWRSPTGNRSDIAPLLFADRVLWVDGESHLVTSVEAETGITQWTMPLAGAPLPPVVFGEVVIVMCRDGQMLGLDSRTGGIRWQRATSIPFDSAPTLADGVIFAGGADRMLYAVAPPALS